MSRRKSKSRFTLDRRTLLRGLVGGAAVCIGLPPLEAMFNANGDAYADGTQLPRRFGIFFWGNGVLLPKWNPAKTGAGYALSEQLAGLAPVKDYVSVVSGMDIKTGNERGHHAGCVGMLSGAPMISQDPGNAPYASTFSAPSVDQIVANALVAKGVKKRFKSLEYGIAKNVTKGEGTTLRYLSHNGPDNANEPEYSPLEFFKRVFTNGFVLPGDPGQIIDPKLALRRSVLTGVSDEAKALQKRMSVSDQKRVDQHLEGIRALENQILLLEEQSPVVPHAECKVPSMPSNPSAYREISDAMNGVLAMALACDQTRVFTNLFSGSVGGASYDEIGVSGNHHSLTHDEPGTQPGVNKVTKFIVDQFSSMLQALKNVPEGDGNLLDNCVIYATSDTAEGRPHSIKDYPILVAGRGGGTLKHPGIHHRAPGQNTSKVLLTLLNAMDLGLTEFGKGGGRVTSEVGEIKA